MPYSGPVSVQNTEDVFFGEWPRIYAIADPLGAAVEVNLGAVKGGSLTTSRETIDFMGTTFPQLLEISVPSTVGMQFAGTAHELTLALAHFLVGDDAITSAENYVYPGAACAFGDIDVTLRGERENCGGAMITFQFHRARASGAIEIGSGNDAIGTPLTINALNDSNGLFGGSQDSPLGFLWMSRN